MKPHKLFISHSSGDAAVARELRAILEADGYGCWMAPDDVTGTSSWIEQILEAIKGSAAMIVLVSDRANRSSHVSREVALAFDRQHPVLPIHIESVGTEGELEYLLKNRQYLDAFPPPISSHADTILRRLHAMLGEPAPESSPQGPRARTTPFGRLRAWARANTPLTLAASVCGAIAVLFVSWSVLVGGSGSTPSASPSGGTAEVTPSPSARPTATPTPTPTPAPTPTLAPTPTPTPYFTEAEQALLDTLPAVTGSAVNCRRDDAPWKRALASVVCDDPDSRSSLLYYGSFSDVTDMDATFTDLMRFDEVAAAESGKCPDPNPVFGSRTWLYDDGGKTQGQLACYEFGQGVKYTWTFNERLILSAWVAPTNKRGFDFWSSWVLGTKPTP